MIKEETIHTLRLELQQLTELYNKTSDELNSIVQEKQNLNYQIRRHIVKELINIYS